MITSVRLVNFKNFADETLRVGPFTVIVGANASGKSNIRDAFRFLHGISRGYTLAEIVGGKYGEGGYREWSGIRGAPSEIIRYGQRSLSLIVLMGELSYSIRIARNTIRPGAFRVTMEELKAGSTSIYTSHPKRGDPVRAQGDRAHLLLRMAKTGDQRKFGHRISVRSDQPALTQLLEQRQVVRVHKEYAYQAIQSLANMRFLDLEPNRIRQLAFPDQTILGDGGENLPAVLEDICRDDYRQKTLASWVRELTPMDVQGFEFPRDPSGRIHLQFVEGNNRKVSAYSASDGTLRYLAILASLLGKNPTELYFFEEIDNGIHANRLWLLVELLERQTASNGTQIITTTHSPTLLTLISDATFENTSITYRDEKSSDAVIRPVAELPNSRRLRDTQGLGRLLTGGWMETALAFTEGGQDENPEVWG